MASRTVTWDIANNTTKTESGKKEYYIWEDVNVTLKVNLNSTSGGTTKFTFDGYTVTNTANAGLGSIRTYNSAFIKDLYVTGGAGNDTFTLKSLDDDGFSGSDYYTADWNSYIYMNDGNDTVNMYDGAQGTDYISLGSGDDYAAAGDYDDTVYGGSGDDILDAGTGNNQVYGEDGNDQLSATLSTGNTSTLTGGNGYDLFTLCSDLYVSGSSTSASTDWGSFAAGSISQYGTQSLATMTANAVAGLTTWNPIVATGAAFGGAMVGKLVSSLVAGNSTSTTTNMVSGTYITIADFDPREDSLQLTFDKDVSLAVDYSGTTGATLYVKDTTGAYRVKATLDSEFTALFGNDPNDILSMMNVYLKSGLYVTSSSVKSNGKEISLSGYTDSSGGTLTVSDFGVTSGNMYVMGSFAGQTLSGGYSASTPILVGTAAADIVSAQEIDFTKTDSSNAIESMDQVKSTNQHTIHGAAGSDVLIGATARDSLNGGDGVDHLYGLGGVDTLTGGYGVDYFHVFTSCQSTDQYSTTASVANAGNDIITDFGFASALGEDDIIYVDSTSVKASDVKFAQSGSDIVISFTGQSNTVTLQNKTLTDWSFSASTDSSGHVMITGTYTGETSGGCFITTATAEQFGWADDCSTLAVLRWFRDNVMAKRPDWKADIATYYKIAPQIVAAARGDGALYRDLWNKSLRKAVAAVVAGKHQRAYDIYRRMVDTLAARYLKTGRVHRVA